jgi:hypothetical protein
MILGEEHGVFKKGPQITKFREKFIFFLVGGGADDTYLKILNFTISCAVISEVK